MAQALESVGVQPGDRVATLAMNHNRHLIAWYGAVGMGGVLHTINPRLFDDQLEYIANHAEDRVLLYDAAFAPLVERMKPQMDDDRALCLLRPTEFERRCFADWLAPRRRLPLVRGRRARPVRPLLHQRDHRQSQGRAVRASLDHAPHDGRVIVPTCSTCRPARWCCRSCRCSTPTPGASPGRRRWSAASWCCRADNRPEQMCKLFQRREGHPFAPACRPSG